MRTIISSATAMLVAATLLSGCAPASPIEPDATAAATESAKQE